MVATDPQYCQHCIIDHDTISIADYYSTMKIWTQKVETGVFKLLSGDCPLNDLENHIATESQYTYNHYFQCECGNYLRSGICIRSSVPILEQLNEPPTNELIV